jgi:hypothetical protein
MMTSRQTALIIPVLLLCLCIPVSAENAHDTAAELIKKKGGRIYRDKKTEGNPIVEVRFSYINDVFDADLKILKDLKSLQTLDLERTNITDAGVREIGILKNLQTLRLDATKVTDACLKDLKNLKNLETLGLWGY